MFSNNVGQSSSAQNRSSACEKTSVLSGQAQWGNAVTATLQFHPSPSQLLFIPEDKRANAKLIYFDTHGALCHLVVGKCT
jgi:hypothetical protein